MTEKPPIRVMLVDDSAIVRGLMQRALKADPEIEIVATANDGQVAVDTLARVVADIVVLDIEMPVMDGLSALPLLLKIAPGIKIIMASTLTMRNAEISMRAMELGATDYLPKPSAAKPDEVQEFYRNLIEKIKALAPRQRSAAPAAPKASFAPADAPVPAPAPAPAAKPMAVAPPRAALATAAAAVGPVVPAATIQEALSSVPRADAIAIASSTGGPQALLTLFAALKGRPITVPIFITQHMPPNFTTILAEHIGRTLGAECHEGRDGEEVSPGVVYLAPGDYHMTAERQGTQMRIRLNQNPPENFCRPSADPMLRSLSAAYGRKLVVVVLTGMGSDGAPGAAEVVKAGGTVAAQNEASCVVYGMPRAIVEAKLARAILPLDQVAPYIARAMGV